MGQWTGHRVWTSNWELGSTSQQPFQTEDGCPSPRNSRGAAARGSVDDIQTRASSQGGGRGHPALLLQQAVPRQGLSQGLTPGADLGQEQPTSAARPHLQPGVPGVWHWRPPLADTKHQTTETWLMGGAGA